MDLAGMSLDEQRIARFTCLAMLHSFRKTTATTLDEAGLSARMIADQLGHARPSMTQDVYMGRKVVDTRVAAALEDALGKSPSIVAPVKE
jgi:integrase